MKILSTVLAMSALAVVTWAPAQATTVHHHHVHYVHVVHHYHHHYYAGGVSYYGAPGGYYPPPPGYYPGPYALPGVYVPGYFYATPEEPLGNRGFGKALIDSE